MCLWHTLYMIYFLIYNLWYIFKKNIYFFKTCSQMCFILCFLWLVFHALLGTFRSKDSTTLSAANTHFVWLWLSRYHRQTATPSASCQPPWAIITHFNAAPSIRQPSIGIWHLQIKRSQGAPAPVRRRESTDCNIGYTIYWHLIWERTQNGRTRFAVCTCNLHV